MYNSNQDSQSPKQPPKPIPPEVKADTIPADLKTTKRWVSWRYEYRTNANGEGKWTKVPINARTFANARSNDPDTWVLFDAASNAYSDAANNLDGVGFMLGDGWAGIDIDNCLDASQNFIIDAAPEVIKNMDTYTEVSPSGRGVKMLFQANTGKGRKFGGLECYSQGRFFTITGHHLPDTPEAPQPRQQQAEEFLATYFDADASPVEVDHSNFTPQPITDKRLKDALERGLQRPYGERFRCLWRGEWQGLDYPSQSEADCGLLNYLAYELGPDPKAIDALFRQSGLMRPKWDSKRGASTWGRQRIDFVLAEMTKWHQERASVLIEDAGNELLTEGTRTSPLDDGAFTDQPTHYLPDLLTLFATVKADYDWVVKNRLRQGVANVCGGPSKGGKTVFTLNWLIDAVLSGKALGHEATKSPLLYLDYENDTIYVKQVISAALDGRSLEGLAQYMRLSNLDVQGVCALPSHLCLDYLDKIIKPYAQPGVIVADTIRGCFSAKPKLPPKWEDDHSVIGNLLRPITAWCHKTGWTVNFIHHTNKAGILSGSTEIMAAVDSIWEFERIKDARDVKKDTRNIVVRIKGRMPAQDPFYMTFDGNRYHYLGSIEALKESTKNDVIKFWYDKLENSEEGYSGDMLVMYAQEALGENCLGEKKMRTLIKELVVGDALKHDKRRYTLSQNCAGILSDNYGLAV